MEGKTIYIDDISLILGGCVSNTGVAMHRLGAPVTLCSKIGDDPLGDVVRRMLEKTGTKYVLARSTGKNSSATIVVTPEGKDRTFWHRRGASQEYCFGDLPQECLKDSALFHFGYPTGMECMYSDGGDTLQALFQGVKEMGLTTSLDLTRSDKCFGKSRLACDHGKDASLCRCISPKYRGADVPSASRHLPKGPGKGRYGLCYRLH